MWAIFWASGGIPGRSDPLAFFPAVPPPPPDDRFLGGMTWQAMQDRKGILTGGRTGNGDKKPDLPISTHYFDGPNGLVLAFTNLRTVFLQWGFTWFLCRPSFSKLGFVPSPIFKTEFCAEPHSQNWVLCRAPFSKSGFVPSPHLKRWFCDEAVFVMKHFVRRSPPKFWFCAEWRCR